MVSCSDLRGFRELPRLAVLLVTLSILIYLGHMAGIGRCSVGYGSSLSPAFQLEFRQNLLRERPTVELDRSLDESEKTSLTSAVYDQCYHAQNIS